MFKLNNVLKNFVNNTYFNGFFFDFLYKNYGIITNKVLYCMSIM